MVNCGNDQVQQNFAGVCVQVDIVCHLDQSCVGAVVGPKVSKALLDRQEKAVDILFLGLCQRMAGLSR